MLKLSNLIIIFIYLFYLVNSIETDLIDENDETLKSEEHDKFNKSYNNSVFEGISQKLQEDIRIFCIILTSPKFKSSKCIPQKNTWLKRCNGYIFASSKNDTTLPSIESFPKDNYKYSYADDNAYLVMENLRAFLLNEYPDSDSYFGFTIYNPPGNVANGYIQGGSEYVFSRKTLNTLVEKGLSNKKYCTQRNDVFDDKEIGRCLFRMGILPTFLVDDRGRIVFSPERISSVIAKEKKTMDYLVNTHLFNLKEVWIFLPIFQ
uniref:Uncharacterized protein n=1 Tax=Strongyloides venezuelensis TaxID=75913 RepID=A0A0K0F4Q6_STRVS